MIVGPICKARRYPGAEERDLLEVGFRISEHLKKESFRFKCDITLPSVFEIPRYYLMREFTLSDEVVLSSLAFRYRLRKLCYEPV